MSDRPAAHRNAERAGGLLLLGLLGWHAAGKLGPGLLPEMFWACHLASAAAALGLLLGRPSVAALGGLFHLACGLPGWIAELILHGTTLSSVGLHLATPALGLWAAWRHGVPRWVAAGAAGLWLVGLGLGRLFDPALNINAAWRPYEIWPAGTPNWLTQLCNLALVGGLVGALQLALNRLWRRR